MLQIPLDKWFKLIETLKMLRNIGITEENIRGALDFIASEKPDFWTETEGENNVIDH